MNYNIAKFLINLNNMEIASLFISILFISIFIGDATYSELQFIIKCLAALSILAIQIFCVYKSQESRIINKKGQ